MVITTLIHLYDDYLHNMTIRRGTNLVRLVAEEMYFLELFVLYVA